MKRLWLRHTAVLVVATSVLAACAGASSDSGADQAVREAVAAKSGESEYEQRVRVSRVACSGPRRTDALRHGSAPFCAPFDSIPAVDSPHFVAASQVRFLPPAEPVIALDLARRHRAYPVRFLVFHEIVNDVVAGHPIVVTFCPLCNSAVALSRQVGGRTLDFGVSGQLDYANLLMFDRQTLSLWQQLTGEAIAGELEGKRLELIPVQMVSFASWRSTHPSGLVMTKPAGGSFLYGNDPYGGYDADPNQQSIFLRSPSGRAQDTDPRLPPKWRVVGVATKDGAVAFPAPRAKGGSTVETARLGFLPLVAFYRYGTAQPEKSNRLAAAPRGWSATVWAARLGGRELSFSAAKGGFLELTTGSRFDFFGRSLAGPLAGRELRPVPQATAFWFAWSHFHPRTKVAAR